MSNRKFVVFEPGLPMCSYDSCPQYDGRECKETGHRPGFFHYCDPELAEKLESRTADLQEAIGLLEELRTYASIINGDFSVKVDRFIRGKKQ